MLLENNTGEYLHILGQIITKSTKPKEQINKLDYIKFMYCSSK